MLKRTASFPFVAACLTAIATIPAHAQPAGTYGSAPGYTAPQGPAAYGATPGYTAPQGPAAYGATPGYTAPQASQGGAASSASASQGGAASPASARRNVIESQQYDRAVETNRAFRQARMRKECGPISDPELHQSCLASFRQEEPSVGSSSSTRAQRSQSSR